MRGRGVPSHPAGPQTQARQHHEVPAQTQDLAVQADLERGESRVSDGLCWRHGATADDANFFFFNMFSYRNCCFL